MPLLTQVSKKSLKAKFLIAFFYVALILGGITMVYPFLIMISGSMKGSYNAKYMNIVPRFLYDDVELYRAWSESFFGKVAKYNESHSVPTLLFDDLKRPEVNLAYNQLYRDFLNQYKLAEHETILGATEERQNSPENSLAFRRYLVDKYGSLENLNETLKLNFASWSDIRVKQGGLQRRGVYRLDSAIDKEVLEFRSIQPEEQFYQTTIAAMFRSRMIYPFTSLNIESVNEKTGLNIKHFYQINPNLKTGNAWFQKQRNTFIKQFITTRYINVHVNQTTKVLWQEFLKENFSNSLAAAQAVFPEARSFNDIALSAKLPADVKQAALFTSFVEKKCPLDQLILVGPEISFQNYLANKYKTILELNEKLGTSFNAFSEVHIPRGSLNAEILNKNSGKTRWELATINLRYVTSYIFEQGRAAFVTVVFCGLSILIALIFNPLAAYALSRYSLPTTYKILLFLMATMAFPSAVTSIPSFLLLRDFNLLNTFWALILPGVANGYSIFILKGFFDSLPKELYEAASIDGASETRMFIQLTLNLSKPVLALIALNTFTGAYGAFMFALLICQDESMWTIMVYIFQLQSRSNQAVVYASLLIAALPTFVIFVTCQNVIMRGIVVPSEK